MVCHRPSFLNVRELFLHALNRHVWLRQNRAGGFCFTGFDVLSIFNLKANHIKAPKTEMCSSAGFGGRHGDRISFALL